MKYKIITDKDTEEEKTANFIAKISTLVLKKAGEIYLKVSAVNNFISAHAVI